MARNIASRLVIIGTLRATGPLHVGGAGGNADADLALALNGQGELYVPGTSLAGPLRAWLLDQVDGNQTAAREAWRKELGTIWGFQDPEETDEKKQGQASFVIVEDGLVTLPPDAIVEIRDGVGIDRITGAAAEHIKYNREVLPGGAEIDFNMTVELQQPDAPARTYLLAALQALQAGKIRFGAAKSRGLGKVVLNDLVVKEQKFNSFDDLLATLRDDQPSLDISEPISLPLAGLPQAQPRVPQFILEIGWEPRGPLMVKAERDGVAVDMLPLVSAQGDKLTFVLPGSSIKGALRNQAERIVRTLCGIQAPSVVNSRESFLKQVEVMEREGDEERERSLIGALFGAAGKAKKKVEDNERVKKDIDEEGPPLLGLSALTVEDCYAAARFTPKQWEEIETAPDANAEQKPQEPKLTLPLALEQAGLQRLQQAFHVAIDRWTGGAADGFLYTVLEPHGIAWKPIQLTLDLARVRPKEQLPAVMCLLLTLRDLVNGRIPLGFAANRGMGAIKITSIEITTDHVAGELAGLRDVKLVDGKLGGWSQQLQDNLEKAWTAWREKNTRGGEDHESLRTRQ